MQKMGAGMLFLGDFYTPDEYIKIVDEVRLPIVTIDNAFITCEQPIFSVEEWKEIGVKMMIYWSIPLFAAMKAVTEVVQTLKRKGTVKEMKDEMFTFEEYGDVVGL